MATIEFLRPQHLDAQRSLDGLALTIPSKIAFKALQTGQVPMISDLHAVVSMGQTEVGIARDEDVYKGGRGLRSDLWDHAASTCAV
jgi:hypothetical protein